jgi:hypothetical protein
MTVRKAESSPIPNPGGTNGFPASTFFAEAAPATIVEMRLPDIGGPPPPLIWPPDLFRMKNAISAQPIKGTIPTHLERRESR